MPTAESLKPILKQYWGYDAFRPLQPEAMQAVLRDRDSVVILPTGGGKSLCFQAPALARSGMALVISPLISLMKDQVDALVANGVGAACINSSMTNVERREVHEAIQEKRLKLLYVSPERMVQPSFIDYIRGAEPSFIVIDEAHCISQWGHDFRPDYRALSCLRQSFPDTAMHAYTATATEQVRGDIMRELGLRDPEVLVGSFDRPNLNYRVERRGDGFAQICDVIERHPDESGVIYCIRRADVDTLCERLNAKGHRALPYHAGMSDVDRKRNQNAFTREKANIIVATVAFGMGIDKSNVRYVVHQGMPKSIEHYQQESGRAGRDGLEAECCLLFGGADYGIWRSFIEKMEDADGARVAMMKLNAMYDFCNSMACRHAALVRYFGQPFTKPSCGACDVCLDESSASPESQSNALSILTAINEIGDYAGPSYTTLVLTGSREERVLAKGHDKLIAFGSLKGADARTVRDWIEQLVGQGYVSKYGEYNLLRVTREGQELLAGEGVARLSEAVARKVAKPTSRAAKSAAVEGPYNTALFEALRAARKAQAEEMGVPPFIVFSDVSLRDMARRMPANRQEFLQVQGVGQAKCDAFADTFLKVIEPFVGSRGESADSQPVAKPAKAPRNAVKSAPSRAYELFEQGISLDDICEILQRKISTVEGYLADYIAEKNIGDWSPWVDASTAKQILDAAANEEVTRLKQVFEALDGEVSYFAIRTVLTCARNASRSDG